MWRTMISLAVGLALGTAMPSHAQKSNDKKDDEVKRLQQQIEKIQAAIKAAEDKIREAEQSKPADKGGTPEPPAGDRPGRPGGRGPGPRGGAGGFAGGGFGGGAGMASPDQLFNMLSGGKDVIDLKSLEGTRRSMAERMLERMNITPKDGKVSREDFRAALEKMRDRAGQGGGFGPGPGAGGFGGMGPGFGGGMMRFEGGNDVKSLENELTMLKTTSKRIEERIKDVEVRLKKAREEEAQKEKARREEKPKEGTARREGRPSADVEKRLDRIEQILDEIQKELKKRRSER